MPGTPPKPRAEPEYEGDYRPAASDNPLAHLAPVNVRVEPADLSYLLQLADALNTTLDLQTLLNRTSELVRAIISYRIFAIFLLTDRTHELRVRFQIGHSKDVEKMHFPLGKGIVGQVALTSQAILLNDVTASPDYISVNPDVRSELSVPLIAKNRLIGVIDLESEKAGFFRPEHLQILARLAVGDPAAQTDDCRRVFDSRHDGDCMGVVRSQRRRRR